MIQTLQPTWQKIFLIITVLVISSWGDDYSDSFDNGIDTTYWKINSNDTLYSIDDTQGNVHFSRSPGGNQIFHSIHLDFLPVVKGDFDVKVDFANAYINRVNGSPGNQVQLNTVFGGQVFSVVRSDEINFGHNFHVWIDPPGEWRGYQANMDIAGTLRIIRIDSLITGYFNTSVIFSDSFNDADVARLTFSLQNNGTTDSTSVVFDDFSITADSIVQIKTGIADFNQSIRYFKLSQNYPNPFNPSTTIEFDLPKTTDVTLKIYNTLGEEVATLVSDRLNAGNYSYEWSRPAGMANGVYLYRLKAGDFVESRKMVLMK